MTSSNKRIDMTHGFMKIIIKNQVDRDRYNKEVSEEKSGRKQLSKNSPVGKSGSPGSKKPEAMIYQPPSKAQIDSEHVLFKLEFVDEKGLVHTTIVSKTDTPYTVAKRMSSIIHLPSNLEQALATRLQREFDSRLK